MIEMPARLRRFITGLLGGAFTPTVSKPGHCALAVTDNAAVTLSVEGDE